LLPGDADERQSADDDRTMRNWTAAGGSQGSATLEAPSAVLREQERAENFPVALRLLPRRTRQHLTAIYDVARVVDDLGDRAAGDRVDQLLAFRDDLELVWTTGEPSSRVLRNLIPTVRECRLDAEPFRNLAAANLQDQRVGAYETFDDLLGYCRLSADPVGRLVLAVFGATEPRTVRLSDRVCTALQLLEFWQDVAEDRSDGRVYLPAESMRAHGVDEADLDAPHASPALRRLLADETWRAESLLDSGSELLGLLSGWARISVAGYVAGGRATARALRRAEFDVLAHTPRPRRTDTAVYGLALLGGVVR
jgi:squalene synthase HpnC